MKLLGSRFKTHAPGVWDFNVRFTDAARSSHPLAVRCDDFVINDEHYLLTPTNDFFDPA